MLAATLPSQQERWHIRKYTFHDELSWWEWRTCSFNHCWHTVNNSTFIFMTVLVLWRIVGLHSTQGCDYCHSQVSFRLNTDETGFFICKECHKTESLWNHTTTDHKEGQLEDRRSVGASSCNSVDGTSRKVQFLMFMIMMMIVVSPYPPLSAMKSSRYPVQFTAIKLWIAIMQ